MRYTLTRGKRPTEKFPVSIDFANDIAKSVGDTAASHVVSCLDDAGTDVAATFLTGPTLNGSISKVTVQAGSSGRTYIVTYKVTSTNGFIYEHDVVIAVDYKA